MIFGYSCEKRKFDSLFKKKSQQTSLTVANSLFKNNFGLMFNIKKYSMLIQRRIKTTVTFYDYSTGVSTLISIKVQNVVH